MKKFWLFFLVIVVVFIVRNVKESLFFSGKERANVIFYGKNANFYSFGLKDDLHYLISFYPDLQLQVPGGYGYYRVGALGKLVNLEKDPEILRQTFSLATSTFVNYYFLPKKTDIYYGEEEENAADKPSFTDVFFSQTNASLTDRLYIYLIFLGKRPQEFNILRELSSLKKDGSVRFSLDDFSKKFQGYFYQKIFREEKKNIQVIYHKNITTATQLAQILEGNGIRVADLTQGQRPNKGCYVKENLSSHSKTAVEISNFFKCALIKESTGIYDIIYIVGDREQDWEGVQL